MKLEAHHVHWRGAVKLECALMHHARHHECLGGGLCWQRGMAFAAGGRLRSTLALCLVRYEDMYPEPKGSNG